MQKISRLYHRYKNFQPPGSRCSLLLALDNIMTADAKQLLIKPPPTSIHDDRWGGPGTCFPWPLESFLSWGLAISCLAVSGYHYVRGRLFSKTQPARLPLAVVSRNEILQMSPKERYQQFQTLLRKVSGKSCPSDEALIHFIQTNQTLRRLATLCASVQDPQLERIWDSLLRVKNDSIPQEQQNTLSYDLAVIVPCYREDPQRVFNNLQLLLDRSQSPANIQIVLVVVETSDQPNPSDNKYSLPNGFGRTDVVRCPDRGRGPALNVGADVAIAHHLVFLHSDTILPNHWDASIKTSLQTNDACCFRFGIAPGSNVPGIRAVEMTANWRCALWKLPYGDQCLCVRASLFHYLGGRFLLSVEERLVMVV